jgi:hypothetical protein
MFFLLSWFFANIDRPANRHLDAKIHQIVVLERRKGNTFWDKKKKEKSEENRLGNKETLTTRKKIDWKNTQS